ncbi:GTPase [Miltoncostaea marina]|uniref:GTPase n=1 Tax=Miltoncostaea marina TaxID=2843215 RepID=UPI001C3E4157|nr:GTPase [Miltoncostaea marina]
MAFTDTAQINVEGGHGGNGCLSFRREPKIPRGGPDGGNGGRGGGVVLEADEQVTDLSRFRHAVHHRAANGGHGQGKSRHGHAGADLVVPVPPGTRVIRDGHTIAELVHPGDRVAVARGGDGGIGNKAFKSSTRQAPRTTVPGAAGEEAWLRLELRLPVDVAIVGLPNAGKSAVLVALTGAGATVAPYPQSTREPALGPLEDEDGNLYLVADLPGVDADGTPRRDAHLGQLERAAVVLHVIDGGDPEPAAERIARVREGIAPFVPEGAHEVVVATRADAPGASPGPADLAVDAETGSGVDELRERLLGILSARRRQPR